MNNRRAYRPTKGLRAPLREATVHYREEPWVMTVCGKSPDLPWSADEAACTCCHCIDCLPIERRAAQLLERDAQQHSEGRSDG